MFIKASSFLFSKYFNFDFYTHKVPFINAWTIYLNLGKFKIEEVLDLGVLKLKWLKFGHLFHIKNVEGHL